jgi:U2 small nuclear ribonucleoprotein B''
LEPNQTVYIHNLNEKLKLPDLKMALYSLYSQFGPIVDLVAMKTAKMRGQAFIVYDNIVSATEAIRQTQGFVFHDRPLRISYAKSKSDSIAKRDGTFVPRRIALNNKRTPAGAPTDRPAKRARNAAAAAAPSLLPASSPELLVANIPAGQSELSLHLLFQQFAGFLSLHMLPPPEATAAGAPTTQRAIAKFQTAKKATIALFALHNYPIIPEHPLHISSL